MPNIILSDALAALPAGAGFLIANQARPPANYLFNSLLPERPDYSYQASSGTMTVRTTMAGLVGMDSPYPEVGTIEATTFSEATAKIAARVRMSEESLRKLQALLLQMGFSGAPTNDTIQNEALNFLDKLVVQSQLDTSEWLRGQALLGAIDWTFNKKRLQVTYGIPTANVLATRTIASNTAYHGSASAFWADVQLIRRRLKGNVRAIIAHPDTIDAIRYNPVNSLVTVAEGAGSITFRKVVGSNLAFSADTGDVVTLLSYGIEGEVYDLANQGQTIKIPFMTRGKLLGIANNSGTAYIVGAGATPPVENSLGYTHIAPTTEGGGQPGRWAEVYVPSEAPWSIEARGVTNLLPVIEAPEKIAIATTEMAP